MVELEIGNVKYRTGRLNTFDQVHVARRLVPIMSGLGQSFSQLPQTQNGQENTEEEVVPENDAGEENAMWKALVPVSEALSKMSDSDVEYILKKCLGTAQRHNGQTWVRVMNSGGQLQFEDIDIAAMMQITMSVIGDNFGSFFPAAQPRNSAVE